MIKLVVASHNFANVPKMMSVYVENTFKRDTLLRQSGS